MSPPGNAEERPGIEAPHETTDSASNTVAKQIRMRRDAALRCAPFDDAGHRDELDIIADKVRDIVPWLPWGLPEAVRRAHANDLIAQWGWTVDEVVAVLKVQPRAAA